MNNLIVFGATGMLGNYIVKYFKQWSDFNIITVNRDEFDIFRCHDLGFKLASLLTQLTKDRFIGNNKYYVINCIGLVKQRQNITNLEFIEVNSRFPLVLSNICEDLQVRMIHITTDCVFSGNIGLGQCYNELDLHDGTDIYGKSKSMGESDKSNKYTTTIRTSIIGEELKNKLSLIEWLKSKKGMTIDGYTNHYWNGVTCLQLAEIIDKMIELNIFWSGTRHIFSNVLSKRDLVDLINEYFELNLSVYSKNTPKRVNRALISIFDTFTLFKIPPLEVQIEKLSKFSID